MTFNKKELEFLDDAMSELIGQGYWDCCDETDDACLLWDKIRKELERDDFKGM